MLSKLTRTSGADAYAMWELSNLRAGCKPVRLFYFGAAYLTNYL